MKIDPSAPLTEFDCWLLDELSNTVIFKDGEKPSRSYRLAMVAIVKKLKTELDCMKTKMPQVLHVCEETGHAD